MLRFKDEEQMRRHGLAVDPDDPSKAVPIGRSVDGQSGSIPADGLPSDAAQDGLDGRAEPNDEAETTSPIEADSPHSAESFMHETLAGAVGDISDLDDQAMLAGMEAECVALHGLDAHYPARRCIGSAASDGKAAAMNGQPTGTSMPNPIALQAFGEAVAVIAAAVDQIPDVGDLVRLSDAELRARIEVEGSTIRRIEKEIADREGYLTAARYRRGLLLLELKRRCAHGGFELECKARKIKSQRASEDMRIAKHFPTEAEAGKVPVPRALALIRRSDDSYGPYENCFACPQWLRDAVTRDYEFPGLDVASSHDMHFGDRFYTPEQDGLNQDWVKDCGGKVVWCNPPYNKSVLPLWVKSAWEQSQNGCVVVTMLPFWRNYDWFWEYVKPFAEVRIPGAMVVLDGFGPKNGKKCGNVRGPTDYETIIAVFRKNQEGFLSGWIEPV